MEDARRRDIALFRYGLNREGLDRPLDLNIGLPDGSRLFAPSWRWRLDPRYISGPSL